MEVKIKLGNIQKTLLSHWLLSASHSLWHENSLSMFSQRSVLFGLGNT